MIDYFKLMGRYNRWANRRLFRTCRFLSDKDYLKNRPMFFGSLHGSLNHILLVDQLWKARAQHREFQPSSLEQVLYPDLSSLTAAREAVDSNIIEWVDGQDSCSLEQIIPYHSVSRPDQHSKRSLHQILAHLFTHQIHHRGQVHNQLGGTYAQPPELDLLYFFIDQEQGREG